MIVSGHRSAPFGHTNVTSLADQLLEQRGVLPNRIEERAPRLAGKRERSGLTRPAESAGPEKAESDGFADSEQLHRGSDRFSRGGRDWRVLAFQPIPRRLASEARERAPAASIRAKPCSGEGAMARATGQLTCTRIPDRASRSKLG